MFAKNKNDQAGKSPAGVATIVAAGTFFTGDISSDADLRIDGRVNGNIRSKAKVVVGAEGVVEGTIESAHADIMGRVDGEIAAAESLSLRGSAQVNGNIATRSLTMEAGVSFNGECRMGQVTTESAKGDMQVSPRKQDKQEKKVALVHAN